MAGQKGNQNAKGCKTSGQPPKSVDWESFEEMCFIQCTQVEMANILRLHPETLAQKVKEHYGVEYLEAFDRYSSGGKKSLRRRQYALSEHNANMAIHLGKLWLGQRDPDSPAAILEKGINVNVCDYSTVLPQEKIEKEEEKKGLEIDIADVHLPGYQIE